MLLANSSGEKKTSNTCFILQNKKDTVPNYLRSLLPQSFDESMVSSASLHEHVLTEDNLVRTIETLLPVASLELISACATRPKTYIQKISSEPNRSHSLRHPRVTHSLYFFNVFLWELLVTTFSGILIWNAKKEKKRKHILKVKLPVFKTDEFL